MSKTKTFTKDFAEFIKDKLAADPILKAKVAEEVFNSDVAILVYDARLAAGLTQKQLAELIGTKQSVISRIEDADYQGHSLSMLQRIAKALGKRLRVEFYTCPPHFLHKVTESFEPQWESDCEWCPDFHEAA